jgi:hypothetical protein
MNTYTTETEYLDVFDICLQVKINVKVKVKESRNSAGVAQRVPGRLGSQIFMTFGT